MTDKLSGDAVTYYQIYDTGAVAVLDAFATTEPVEGLTTRGAFFDPVNSLVTGDKTQEQWVKEFAEASDAFRGALKE